MALSVPPAPPVPARKPVPPKAPPPPLTAAHGAEIVALAVTPDGSAVASADRLGGIRLWTALDGTREPVVIHGPAPRSVTLTHNGDDFVIGTLDAAGGVQVIRTSGIGAVRGRVTVTGDQPATEIDGIREGLLILRADQTLELVDATGQVRSRLASEPGTHIDSILVRGRHVLALVMEDKRLHGRWILLDHGVHWGESTPKIDVKIAHAVLSPDGHRLAVTRPRNLHPLLIDLATGLAQKTPLCVAKQWPRESGEDIDESQFLQDHNAPVPLGFLSGTVVACSVVGTLVWWNTNGSPEPTLVGSFAVGGLPADMSDRALIVGVGPNLALGTPSSSKFLGYGLQDIAHLRAGAAGVLVSGVDQQSFVLDAGLRERARFDLGRTRVDWSDVVALDDRYAITAAPQHRPNKAEVVALAVFDGVTRTQHQLLPYEARDKELAYEPATRLLATSDGAASLLLRLDPATHLFGAPIRLASEIAPSKLFVLDPTLASGVAALQVQDTGDGLLVGEFLERDLAPGTTIQPRTTYRVHGELRAVDRAGRLYLHGDDDHDDVVVHTRGAAGVRLPGVAELTLHPNRDGSRIAAFQTPRIVMLTGTGKVDWDTAQWNSAGIDWTATGELLVQFPSAVATLDLETGAPAGRRCGWGFGVSDQVTELGRSGPSICDVEP
ncbi:MAG TPA: hypothetical protein VHN14_20060 [Kofleriaceae bacterium]|jgi:hypothetical protein|nr:hypothetical protein [Kofleriaceae bacterium]